MGPALPWKLLQRVMVDLSERSSRKELLDADNIPFADIRQNMKELDMVNARLGGHSISISAVKKFLESNKLKDITICEVGCGGGDNLAAIDKWCSKHRIQTRFIGIDIKKECIEYAKEQHANMPVTWIVSDYRTVTFTQKPTIIFSSLFCHHFTNEEVVSMLKWMSNNSTTGFFINDLQRHIIPYQLIKNLTALFSRSYLVRNDAPLSVARGFKKHEWKGLLRAAGILNYSLEWKWAFRFLIIVKNYGPKAI